MEIGGGMIAESGAADEPAHDRVDLKRNSALFLLRTKEINRVSQRALDDIVGGVTGLFEARLLQLKEDLLAELDPEYSELVTAKIDGIAQPFKKLESQFTQEKYFKEELHMLVNEMHQIVSMMLFFVCWCLMHT